MRSSYINPGDKASISVKVSNGPRRFYMSYIDALVDEQTLLICTPIFKGQAVRLSTFEDYEFVFYAQTGLYHTDGKALVNFVENNVAIVKVRTGCPESIQCRELYRVITIFESAYTYLMLGVDETGDLFLYPVTGENISGGGMCLLSPTLLSEEESIHCILPIRDQMTIIETIVLHIESPEDSRKLYGTHEYRARFYLREKCDQGVAMQYMFAKQRGTLLRHKMQPEAVNSDDKNQGTLRRR